MLALTWAGFATLGRRRRPLGPVESALKHIAQAIGCKATGHIASKATARFTSCRLRLRSSDRTVLACGGEVLAAAILDRLLHRAHVLNIKGRSYRLRNLEDALKLSHA